MWLYVDKRYTLVLTKPRNLVYYGDLTIEQQLIVTNKESSRQEEPISFESAQFSKSSQNLYLMDTSQQGIYKFKLDNIAKVVKNQQKEEYKNIVKSSVS